MVVGDNGVLNKSTQAADKTIYAKAEEDLKLIVSGATAYWKDAEANEGLTQTYLEYFDENYATGKTLEEKGNIIGATGTYTYTSNNGTIIKFNLSDTGKITIITDTEEDDGKVAIEANYIKNYKVDLNGDGDYTNDWRMFYIATAEDASTYGMAEGTMYIIAADYVPVSNTILDAIITGSDIGITSYNAYNGVTTYAYSVYWPSSSNYIWASEYDASLAKNQFMLSQYTLTNSNTNSECVSQLLYTEAWKGFLDGTYGQYAIGRTNT